MEEVAPLSASFPKARRLRKRPEFLRAQRGQTQHGSGFALTSFRRGDDGPCRLGVVASRRVGNAVARNWVKRRVREWFRQLDEATLPRGVDLVVVARPAAASLGGHEIAGELGELLRRVLGKGSSWRAS